MVRTTHQAEASFSEIPGGLAAAFLATGDEIQLGLARADPGAGEKWHRHHPEVEEIYYTVAGAGRLTWDADGERRETTVEPGEVAYLEKGGLEHEIRAIGEEPWEFVFAINNPDVEAYSDIFERYGEES